MPAWAADEIREAWADATMCGSQLQAFRILERMVERLGYGRYSQPIVTLRED